MNLSSTREEKGLHAKGNEPFIKGVAFRSSEGVGVRKEGQGNDGHVGVEGAYGSEGVGPKGRVRRGLEEVLSIGGRQRLAVKEDILGREGIGSPTRKTSVLSTVRVGNRVGSSNAIFKEGPVLPSREVEGEVMRDCIVGEKGLTLPTEGMFRDGILGTAFIESTIEDDNGLQSVEDFEGDRQGKVYKDARGSDRDCLKNKDGVPVGDSRGRLIRGIRHARVFDVQNKTIKTRSNVRGKKQFLWRLRKGTPKQ